MKSAKPVLRGREATCWLNIIELPGSHCYISGHNLSKLKHFADFLDTLVRKYQINFEFRPMPKSIFSLIFFSTWFVWWRKKGMYLCVSCTPSHNPVHLLNLPCSLFISFTKIASFLDLSIWILEHSPCTKSWSTPCSTLDTLMGSWCAYSVFPTKPNPSHPNSSQPGYDVGGTRPEQRSSLHYQRHKFCGCRNITFTGWIGIQQQRRHVWKTLSTLG